MNFGIENMEQLTHDDTFALLYGLTIALIVIWVSSATGFWDDEGWFGYLTSLAVGVALIVGSYFIAGLIWG